MELHVEELFIWDPILFAGTPFEINRVVLLMFLASAVCMAFFVAGARRAALVPTGIQNLAEQAYLFVRNQIAIDIIGTKDGPKYANYLASLFWFIFFMNVLEITPLINFPVTSRMAIPAFLALLTYVVFNVQGIRKQGLRYFTNIMFPPDVPKLVYLFLTPIELFSTFVIRPLTLSVRLLANMMAGHVLLTIFFLFTAEFFALDITLPLGALTAVVAVVLIMFEMLVIGIQAYIFTTLTAFYIAEAIHGHGEGEHETEEGHPEALQETEGLEPATAGAR
jgi:F-type H+-transporting ATPase subunit a